MQRKQADRVKNKEKEKHVNVKQRPTEWRNKIIMLLKHGEKNA
jgi:hypothetical protein